MRICYETGVSLTATRLSTPATPTRNIQPLLQRSTSSPHQIFLAGIRDIACLLCLAPNQPSKLLLHLKRVGEHRHGVTTKPLPPAARIPSSSAANPPRFSTYSSDIHRFCIKDRLLLSYRSSSSQPLATLESHEASQLALVESRYSPSHNSSTGQGHRYKMESCDLS
jgi:hypothetical protein